MFQDEKVSLKRLSSLSDGGRRGRKRKKPEKHTSYSTNDDVTNGGEAGDDVTTRQSTPSSDSNDGSSDPPQTNQQVAATGGSIFSLPQAKQDIANRILDHFRDFSKRTNHEQGDLNGDAPNLLNLQMQLAKRKLEAMKSYGSMNYNTYLDPTNVVGSNGIIPERTMRQNNWALKVEI